jgi:hypothetical protein
MMTHYQIVRVIQNSSHVTVQVRTKTAEAQHPGLMTYTASLW